MQKRGLPWSGVQRPARARFRTCLPTGWSGPDGSKSRGLRSPSPSPERVQVQNTGDPWGNRGQVWSEGTSPVDPPGSDRERGLMDTRQ